MKRIALDLDNCTLDTVSSIINLHNKLNENKLQYNTNIQLDWKLRPLIKTDGELTELFKLFDNPQFYNNDTLKIFDNAIKVINTLSMQNYVCIISKHMKSRKPLTRKWIYETFPTVDLVFVDDFNEKGSILNGFDLILDDRMDSLESCQGYVKNLVCYGTYPWNDEWTGLRVNNWLEFKKLVNKLINNESDGIER